MSWSVAAKGAPHLLFAVVAEQANQARENCKALDHEVQQITAAEAVVNNELTFHNAVGTKAVTVSAYGSAYRNPTAGSSEVTVSVRSCPVEESTVFEPAPQPISTHLTAPDLVAEAAAAAAPATEPAPAEPATEPAAADGTQ